MPPREPSRPQGTLPDRGWDSPLGSVPGAPSGGGRISLAVSLPSVVCHYGSCETVVHALRSAHCHAFRPFFRDAAPRFMHPVSINGATRTLSLLSSNGTASWLRPHAAPSVRRPRPRRSEEHTSEL